jgi:hypothetical protein
MQGKELMIVPIRERYFYSLAFTLLSTHLALHFQDTHILHYIFQDVYRGKFMLDEEIIRHVYAKFIGYSYPEYVDFDPFKKTIETCVKKGSIIDSKYHSSTYYEYYDPVETAAANYEYCCWCCIVDDANIKHRKPISRLTSDGATNAISIAAQELKYLFKCIASTTTDVSKSLMEHGKEILATINDPTLRVFCKGADCIFQLYDHCNKNKKKSGKNIAICYLKDEQMLNFASAIGYNNNHQLDSLLEPVAPAQSSSFILPTESAAASNVNVPVAPLLCALCLYSDDHDLQAVPELYVPFLGAISMSVNATTSKQTAHFGDKNVHLDTDNIFLDSRFRNCEGRVVWCLSCKNIFYRQCSEYTRILPQLESLEQHTSEK